MSAALPPAPLDRYPGPHPFSETAADCALFFGREREARELLYRLQSSNLLVLFGKSGQGKTSLLCAGLFPLLRANDLLPVSVRLNQPAAAPRELFAEALATACSTEGVEAEPPPGDTLWELFKGTALWRGGTLLTPVVVIDQFEELFTLQGPAFRARFAEELGDLVGGRLPATLRARRQAGEALPFSDTAPAVQVLISLREDYLGALEGLAAEIPGILDRRFPLGPLQEAEAHQAIVEPARLESTDDLSFATAPFSYRPETLDAMLAFLRDKSGTVEPFQLQLLCRQVEQRVTAARRQRKAVEEVDPSYLGGRAGMEAILADFYRNALRRLSGRRRRRARLLCEEGLLSPEGRRLSVEEKSILRRFRLPPEALAALVDARLLRKEARLESFYYELSHDSLTGPVARERSKRLPAAVRRGLAWVGGGLLLLVGILGVIQETKHRAALRHAEVQIRLFVKAREARAQAEKLLDFLLFDLRDKLAPIGRLDIVEAVQQRVDTYYEQLGDTEQDASTLRRRSVAYNNRGNLLRLRGDLEGALEIYRKSLAIAEYLFSKSPDDTVGQRDLLVSHNKIGTVLQSQGKLESALEAYREGLAVNEKLLASNRDNTLWLRDRSEIHNSIGRALQAQGNLERALAAYQQGLAVNDQLLAREPNNIKWQYDYWNSSNNISAILYQLGDWDGVLGIQHKNLEIIKKITQQDEANTDWQFTLSTNHHNLGVILYQLGDLDGSLAAYRQALEIRERLAQQPEGKAEWQQYLASSYREVGNVLRGRQELEESLVRYNQALKIDLALVGHDSTNIDWQNNLAEDHRGIGDVHCAQHNRRGAMSAWRHGLSIVEALIGRDSTNTNWQTTLVELRVRVASALDASQPERREEAQTLFQQALETLRQLEAEGRAPPRTATWGEEIEGRLAALP